MSGRRLAFAALLVLALCAAPVAAMAAIPANVKRVVRDYRSDGKIDPCKHSAKDLRDTLKAVSADTEQYAPDFPAAIDAALEARARGECDAKRKGSGDNGGGGDAGGGGAPASPPPAPPSGGTPGAVPPATPPVAPAPGGEVVPEPPAPPPVAPNGGITEGTPPPPAADPNTVLTRRAAAGDRGSTFGQAPLIALGGLLAAALLAGLLLLAMRRLGFGDERLAGARHALAEAGYRTGGTWQDFTDWLRLGR